MNTRTATPDPAGLYVSDEEMFKRLNVCKQKGRAAVQQLEPYGFPKQDPLFSNKRYWPAVRRYLDNRHGIGQTDKASSIPSPHHEEDWS